MTYAIPLFATDYNSIEV